MLSLIARGAPRLSSPSPRNTPGTALPDPVGRRPAGRDGAGRLRPRPVRALGERARPPRRGPAAEIGDAATADRVRRLFEETRGAGRRTGLLVELPQVKVPENAREAEAVTADSLVPGLGALLGAARGRTSSSFRSRTSPGEIRSRRYLLMKAAAIVRSRSPSLRIAVLPPAGRGGLFPAGREGAPLRGSRRVRRPPRPRPRRRRDDAGGRPRGGGRPLVRARRSSSPLRRSRAPVRSSTSRRVLGSRRPGRRRPAHRPAQASPSSTGSAPSSPAT